MHIIKRNQISINHQTISSFESISKKISWMLGSYQGPIKFAWIDSMSSIIWNHEIYFMLVKKIEKIKKISWKYWKCMPKGKMASRGLWKIRISKPRYPRMKFEKNENYSSEKYFEDLNKKQVRSQRNEKKDHRKKKVCTEVINVEVRLK